MLDVTMAPPEAAALRLYGPLTYISGDLEAHAKLLTQCGVREVQVHFPFNTWKNAAAVHRGDDGELVFGFDGINARLKGMRNALKAMTGRSTSAAGRPPSSQRTSI